MVAFAIETTAAQGDVELADGLKPELAKTYLAELAKLPPMHDISEAVDTGERFMLLDSVLGVAKYGLGVVIEMGVWSGGKSPPSPDDTSIANVDWDKVLRRMNDWCDRLVAAMDKPTFAERRTALAKLEEEVAALKKKLSAADAQPAAGADATQRWSDVIPAIQLPALSRARELADRCQEHTDLGILAIALAAYRGEHGAYPEKLADLAPAYVKTIPNDIFADAPLKYHKEGPGYVLYSIGPDLKDDGGAAGKTDATGDIVVKMFK
jgi:hypothetical protein